MPPSASATAQRLGSAAIVLAAAAGCSSVAVPLLPFTHDPYPEKTVERLRGADADAVRRAFGEPQQRKMAGRYWFYFAKRPTVGFLGSSAGAMERLEWLALEFDAAARVRFTDRQHGDRPCFANGVCVLRGAIAAPPADDAAAKAYRPSPRECAIYLYQEALGLKFVTHAIPLSVEGREYGTLDFESYLFLTHPPGAVALRAYAFDIAVACKSGEAIYVKASASWRVHPQGVDFAPVLAAEGESALRERRLALAD